MFKRIAEWITGHKTSDNRHPLDYIDRKAEAMHAPYKVEPAPIPVEQKVEEQKPAQVEPKPETTMATKEEKPAKKATKAPAKESAKKATKTEEATKVKKPAPAKKIAVKKSKKADV